jgi:hypothetical protein
LAKEGWRVAPGWLEPAGNAIDAAKYSEHTSFLQILLY